MENEHIISTLIFKLVSMRLMLRADILRQVLRKANFNPDQPRVSAGEPDGGRWTGDGVGSVGPSAHSDLIPIADTPRYSIDLRNYENYYGGHAISEHVEKTDAELIERADELEAHWRMTRTGPEKQFRLGGQAGSFSSLADANDLTNQVLNSPENIWLVQMLERGEFSKLNLLHRFGYKTGKEAFRPFKTSAAYMRDTFAVCVKLLPDPQNTNKFRIVTSYPTNELPGERN
jgi:hypothetical protein